MRDLILYVHEFQKEIGHTRAMLETLKKMPSEKWKSLKIIAFNCGDLQEMFAEDARKVSFHQVPLFWLKPFLSRVLFFHCYTFFWSLFNKKREDCEISIGVAYLFPNIVNVQFVHHHWAPFYFQQENASVVGRFYKKILFSYLCWCEKWVYRGEVKISSLSQFVTDYLKEKFNLREENIKTIYSSVNCDEFAPARSSKQELMRELETQYPFLNSLNTKEEIFLFVGAFQRKGLSKALEELGKLEKVQLIAIGQNEAGKSLKVPDNINFLHIPFTSKLPLFYNLADHFIFPTFYEPFGLVILEAFAAGCSISTTRRYVGASELLEETVMVNLYDNPENFEIKSSRILNPEERVALVRKRREDLGDITWQKAGENFSLLLDF